MDTDDSRTSLRMEGVCCSVEADGTFVPRCQGAGKKGGHGYNRMKLQSCCSIVKETFCKSFLGTRIKAWDLPLLK
jgi:hypothetical protein